MTLFGHTLIEMAPTYNVENKFFETGAVLFWVAIMEVGYHRQ